VRIGALTDSSLIAKLLAQHRRVLVASPAWLAAQPKLVMPEDLMNRNCLPFALQPSAAWYYRPFGDPSSEPRSVTVSGNLRANDSEALLSAALNGLGVALLPTWLVGEALRAGKLVGLLPEWTWSIAPGSEAAIWCVYPPKKVVPPKVRAFIDFMVRTLGAPPYWEKMSDSPRQ
jgi:DNA-binding transcriptional LysR family regulator